MAQVKVIVGSQAKNTRFWMDGTREEVVDKIKNRFRIYTERPTKAKTAKTTTKKATKTAEVSESDKVGATA